MSKRWYVVHAYSGFEHQVQRGLLSRIERAGMQDKFGQVLVPTEEVVEVRVKNANQIVNSFLVMFWFKLKQLAKVRFL